MSSRVSFKSGRRIGGACYSLQVGSKEHVIVRTVCAWMGNWKFVQVSLAKVVRKD